MGELAEVLADLSDEPSDLLLSGGEAIFSRHGREYVLHFVSVPSLGICVDRVNDGSTSPRPIYRFVQEELLGLPRLARQIQRALNQSKQARPGNYVDGPATATINRTSRTWQSTRNELERTFAEYEPGSTRIIQLMAPAGQGKTVLLEEAAITLAQKYVPDAAPSPLVLVVDLLGRYVGSIDDAIAGALNNTYLFPGLSQRDVVYCMRKNWLILALDGFDELAARIGPRDAFLRISDLVDQLNASGTVLLSARESFFDLYRISASIRTYLQPKIGTYTTGTIVLDRWGKAQGVEVFRSLRAAQPENDVAELLRAFDNDQELVLQPFFLTRLAQLWLDGERFANAKGIPAGLGRFKYVIEAFVGREVGKWKDREQNEILSLDQHINMLASIAEEMWLSGAFRLTFEELQIATELAVENWHITPEKKQEILGRVATHGALVTRDQRISFLHERFFEYFFSVRASKILLDVAPSLAAILSPKEIGHSLAEWIVWMVKQQSTDIAKIVRGVLSARSRDRNDTFEENAAYILARLLSGLHLATEMVLPTMSFSGEALKGGIYADITFKECSFWQVDLRGTTFNRCRFEQCTLGDVATDASTAFGKSVINSRTTIASLDVEDRGTFFAPHDIRSRLQAAGAIFEAEEVSREPQRIVGEEVSFAVERYVRASEKTTDVAMEDMVEQYGELASIVAKVAIRTNVLKKVEKDTSGPRKTFVRFKVDRDKLLRGQAAKVGDPVIDGFWQEMEKRSHRYR